MENMVKLTYVCSLLFILSQNIFCLKSSDDLSIMIEIEQDSFFNVNKEVIWN